MNFRFDHPEYLWLLLLAVPIVALGMYSLAALDRVRRWTSIGLRLAVLLILVCMVAGLQAVRWHEDLTVVAVVDESESVRRFAQPPLLPGDDPKLTKPVAVEQWIGRWIAASADGKRADDRLGLVTFDGRAKVRGMPSTAIDTDPASITAPTDGTDTPAAVRMGMALFPEGSGKRMVLVGDGNDTVTSADGGIGGTGASGASGGAGGEALLAAAREAKAAGIAIDVLPLDYQVRHEVMVEGVYVPTEAREGQTVALRVVLRATEPTDGSLYLKHDGEPVDLTPQRQGSGATIGKGDWTIEEEHAEGTHPTTNPQTPTPDTSGGQNPTPDLSGRYVCVKLINLPLAYGGVNKYEATFEPADQNAPAGSVSSDTIAANNRAESFTLVHGKGRVLVVNNLPPASAEILPNALKQHGIELDMVDGYGGVPNSLTKLQRYDAVILQNVPAEMVPPPTQRLLARYVNDMGGGLIMVGGPDSFAAGGWTHTPIDQILPIECEIPSQTILPAGALMFVIDRSGSMSSPVAGTSLTQQEVAGEAAVLALNSLYPQDLVGVVAFDESAKWVVNLRINDDPKTVAKAIRSITPGGGTNIYPGLEEAYIALSQVKTEDAAVKHIILLTDGQSQDAGYTALCQKMVQAGITLSTVGVGDGPAGGLLNMLAQMTGGTYYEIKDPNDLPQVFIKEARTIRKNLIKEKPFTPQLVQTGSPIMSGITAVPELKGFVLTGAKADSRVYMPMVGPEGEPVFAHWQVGLGRSAAFTSDATNRWAVDWLNWGGYADFWGRTVRAIARPSATRQYDLLTTIRNDKLVVRLDAPTPQGPGTSSADKKAGGFANFLQIEGSVLAPDGSTVGVTLHQTGPGLYETQVPAHDAGNYVVSLFVQGEGGERQAVFGGASKATGAELRRFRSNPALLRQVAQITGGRVLDPADPKAAALFDRQSIVPSRSIRPLWRDLMPWLLLLFLLDVASRRIAWDAATTARWVRERGRAIFATRKVEAEATLDALKARAARTQEAMPRPNTEPVPLPAAVRTTVATRKFEAAPGAVASENFAEAVGGASVSQAGPAIAVADETKKEQPQTTSRLLDAKRRARGRTDENIP